MMRPELLGLTAEEHARWEEDKARLARVERLPPLVREEWLRAAFLGECGNSALLRRTLRELRERVLSWAEARSRELTVNDARLLDCCRVCRCSPPRSPLVLDYGREYACLECVGGRTHVG